MTEAEWLACADPTLMLESLRGEASARKLRLFALACVQRFPALYPAISQVIQMSELYAEGAAGWTELASARKLAKELYREAMQRRVGLGAGAVRDVCLVASPSAFAAAQGVIPMISFAPEKSTRFVHDIFGNPFRPVVVDPSWLTSDVVVLAEGIYQDRAVDRMPILADALQDAGCDSDDILNHCRQPGEHVRGCWVIDLLTGRK